MIWKLFNAATTCKVDHTWDNLLGALQCDHLQNSGVVRSFMFSVPLAHLANHRECHNSWISCPYSYRVPCNGCPCMSTLFFVISCHF